MKNYKHYQVIFTSNTTGETSEIVIASCKSEAKSKVLTRKPYIIITDCIDISC
jgi:hypothetical protein